MLKTANFFDSREFIDSEISLDFDGLGASLPVPDLDRFNIINFNSAWSVSCMVRFEDFSTSGGSSRFIFDKGIDSFNRIALSISASGLRVQMRDSSASLDVFSTSVLNGSVLINRWNHVVVTYSGDPTVAGTLRMYINGRLIAGSGTIAARNDMVNGQLVIGDNNFDGQIAHFSIFNKELSSEEINHPNFLGGDLAPSSKANCIAYWPMQLRELAPYDFGQALVLNGSSQYAENSTDAISMGDGRGMRGNFSIRSWVRPDTASLGTVISFFESSTNWLAFNNTGTQLSVTGFVGGGDLSLNASFTNTIENSDVFIGIDKLTNDTSNWGFIVNGDSRILATPVSSSLDLDDVIELSNPRLGVLTDDVASNSNFFNGDIHEVILTKPELTSSQSEWIYNNGQGRDITSAAAKENGIGILNIDGTVDGDGLPTFTSPNVTTLVVRHIQMRDGNVIERITDDSSYASLQGGAVIQDEDFGADYVIDVVDQFNSVKNRRWQSLSFSVNMTAGQVFSRSFTKNLGEVAIYRIEDGGTITWDQTNSINYTALNTGTINFTLYLDNFALSAAAASFASSNFGANFFTGIIDYSDIQYGGISILAEPNPDSVVSEIRVPRNIGGSLQTRFSSEIGDDLDYSKNIITGQIFTADSALKRFRFGRQEDVGTHNLYVQNPGTFSTENNDLEHILDLRNILIRNSFNISSNARLEQILFNPSIDQQSQTLASYAVNSCNFDAIDATAFNINGAFICGANPYTSISFDPSKTYRFTLFSSPQANSLITLDLTTPSIEIDGVFDVRDSSNLATINFNSVANTSSNFNSSGCNLTGTLDLSTFTLTGTLDLSSNALLTSINFGTNVHTFSGNILLDNIGVTSLDFGNSDFTFTSPRNIDIFVCPSLTTLTFGSAANQSLTGNLTLHSCDLSTINFGGLDFTGAANVRLEDNNALQAEVDQWLVDIDNRTQNPVTNSLNIDIGGTNAAPSATGLAAVTSLQGKGAVVTHN